jgi:cbb3-type cytochrome oxidase cytochrome c subunit
VLCALCALRSARKAHPRLRLCEMQKFPQLHTHTPLAVEQRKVYITALCFFCHFRVWRCVCVARKMAQIVFFVGAQVTFEKCCVQP